VLHRAICHRYVDGVLGEASNVGFIRGLKPTYIRKDVGEQGNHHNYKQQDTPRAELGELELHYLFAWKKRKPMK
jgi:hypothetical protein